MDEQIKIDDKDMRSFYRQWRRIEDMADELRRYGYVVIPPARKANQ